jgi:hypothetical protein
MGQARVESIDALRTLKAALIKFAEEANLALSDGEFDVTRTVNWLENEQNGYWHGQHRKWTARVSQCKEAVRMKKIYKDVTGRQQSAIEEEKALKAAQRRLDEAEFKIKAIKRALAKLEKEVPIYKANTQRFATDLLVEIPAATAHLENMLVSLDAYAALDTPVEVTSRAEATSDAPVGSEQTGSMARPIDEDELKDHKKPEEEKD